VEIGCGPGFFKEAYPDVVSTDVVANPFAERIVDAAALPFADGEVGNIVALDVFHHLPRPEQFLREVARTLRRGGRLVLIEPWIGLAGRIFWKYFHHEDCDPRVDPSTPWDRADKDPMLGNAALPFLYFRQNGHLECMGLPLHVIEREPFAALPWLLSGGFQPVSLLPKQLVGPLETVDALVSRVPTVTALRCRLVIQRV
jgi:SAM-dependent methyltransferase